LDLDASALRQEATRCRDAQAAAARRRMLACLALAPVLVVERHAREAAARHAGMDRQTLRDRVHRYNAEGLAGLADRPHPGPKPRLTPEQMRALQTDKARVGQQGTVTPGSPARRSRLRGRTRIRARRGTRPRAPRHQRYAWAYLFGAVCPARAVGAGRVLPYADTEAMDPDLQEIGRHVTPGAAHAVLVLDGASWHGAAALEVPGNLTLPLPPPLPPYGPELNPSGRERLAISATEPAPAQPAGLGRRHGEIDRRDLLPSLERAPGHARPHRFHHPPRMGQTGHLLGPLV
jgi:hypothetical protein